MPVVDASVLVEYLSDGKHSEVARAVVREGDLLAPHLIDAEVGHALRGHVAAGMLGAHEAEQALLDFSVMALARAPHGPLLLTAWALRRNLSFYDALYAALALELDTELVTFDVGLARVARRRRIGVRLLRSAH